MTVIDKSENQETATSGMQSVQMDENGGNVSHEKTLSKKLREMGYTEEDLEASNPFNSWTKGVEL